MRGTDLDDLKYAKMLLAEPSLTAKVINMLGLPFERGVAYLPKTWNSQIQRVSEKSLNRALDFALLSMGKKGRETSNDALHKVAAATSGGVGGLIGLPALGFDLSISTIIMLRSIMDIARSEGEDVAAIEPRLACLEVFALGGRSSADNAMETSYYAVRTALSKAVSDAANYIAKRGLSERGGPVLVRLVAQIGARFGIVVSEKVAASAIPILGAAGGSMINTVFLDHFQDMARGHFIVRRLERTYAADVVKAKYESI
ncbi:MAG: EcsC family protein [Pirellulaceae bacterium]